MGVTYEKEVTALLVIDPYNDFISENGKVWDRLKDVAEANDCVAHMLQVLNAARQAELRVFYALHHRYRPGDYETWKYIAPIQRAAWSRKTFECGTWGGEIRREFEPQPGEIVVGMVGRARQRAGGDEKKSLRKADTTETFEFLRGDVARNGRMLRRRLKILADSEEIDSGRA